MKFILKKPPDKILHTSNTSNISSELNLLVNKIKKNKGIINYDSLKKEDYKNVKTNSIYDMMYSEHEVFHVNCNIPAEKVSDIRKCIQIELKPTPLQKQILQKWFISYIIMYNRTIEKIKDIYKTTNKTIVSFQTLRTQYLKNVRDNIILTSNLNYMPNTSIHTHTLDNSIKLACSNYKSCLTNISNNNIKHFKINKLKFKKNKYLLDIEQCYITSKGIFYNKLGHIDAYKDNSPYDLKDVKSYKTDCKLIYNKINKKYILYIPEKITNGNKDDLILEKENFISLDPGCRTFMTGISENECIKIGTNISSKIGNLLNRKDIINNNIEIKNKIKKKNERLINKRISNIVTELHWKTINYLTKTYKNVFIGDVSSKNTNSKMNKKQLPRIIKQIMSSLCFFKFKERLKYKCMITNTNLKIVNEAYTSQCCSNCGHRDVLLGSKKEYNCEECKIQIDRDINGSICILLKAL